jgi:hypothetical protein
MARFNGSILGTPRGSNSTSASGVWSVNNVGIARLSDAWPIVFSALNSGYTAGGQAPITNVIDKFPFASDSNASDVGDLSVARRLGLAGASSASSGYSSGGLTPTGSSLLNTIDKFPFSVDANATDVGDLSALRREIAGQSSETNGYTSGGFTTPGTATRIAGIDKFPFATNGNATNVGNITQGRYGPAGQNSSTYGYTSGGNDSPATNSNTIDKFSFAAGGNATDVGDLTVARRRLAGQSSSTHGYTTSGNNTRIDKFSFASDGNASNIGTTLYSGGQYSSTGQSSRTSGYNTGGSSPTTSNAIQKFPFATDANATDVGDLTLGRYGAAGQQG